MSLRTRIILWNVAALVLGVIVTTFVTAWDARKSIREEISSAMTSAQRALSNPAEGPAAVEEFDDSRHVRVRFVDRSGRVVFASRPAKTELAPPPRLAKFLAPSIGPIVIPRGDGRFVIEAAPDNEIVEVWRHSHSPASLRLLTTALLIMVIGVVIERALRPLNDLSAGLSAFAKGDYRVRVDERGPPEIAALLQGFNRMGAQLAAAQAQNQALQLRLEQVQDEERAELARDLHDEIGSYLFAANADCATIVRLAEAGRYDEVRAQAEAVQSAVSHMQAQVRGLLERLRAEPTEELGLIGAIRELVGFWSQRTGEATLELDLPEEEPALSPVQRTSLYRVVQEALSNAIRHSRARRIAISLAVEADGAMVLRVENDGAATSGSDSPTGGFGLRGMHERAQTAGAELTAGAGPAGGWLVVCRLPADAIGSGEVTA